MGLSEQSIIYRCWYYGGVDKEEIDGSIYLLLAQS